MAVTVAGARYAVDAAGSRFLMLETADPALEPPVSRPVVVLGWTGARKPLKRRLF